MAPPKVYDSNRVYISIAGRPIATGRAEGEFVSTEFSKEAFTKIMGADGEVTVSRTNDKSGTVKLKLLQTSTGHYLLTQLYALQMATPGAALMDFELRDVAGLLLEHCTCWIEKAPPSAYGAQAGEREWTLGTGELIRETV